MDIDYQEIGSRLEAAFQDGTRLVFWEDEQGEYGDAPDAVALECADIIDVTGHELAAKRVILRERKHDRLVVYRSGEIPHAGKDLLLDVKLSAKPFVCSTEGLWADECGIPAELAQTIADHAAFFKNKERRAALAACPLPKDNPEALRFAMVASLLKSCDAQPRDAARAMAKRALVEWSRGDEQSMRMLGDAGLASSFWSAMREHIGYTAPDTEQPSVGDFAFRLLEGRCGKLIEDAGKASEAESAHLLDDLARDKTRDAFDRIVGEYASAVASMVPDDAKTVDLLESVDAIPQIDEWILTELASVLAHGEADARKAEHVWAARRYGLFADRFQYHYEVVIAIGEFSREFRAYKRECASGAGLAAVLERYCVSWHMVDRRYREVFLAHSLMPNGTFKIALADAVKRVQADYDWFLMDLTDRWQVHLLDEGAWPPESIESQDGFFRNRIEMEFPRAEKGKRVGVIISAAMRDEVGRDLASRLAATKAKGLAGKASVECSHILGMIPSYTQLGMAALLPEGAMEIDPATTAVTKDGKPTLGTANRAKIIGERMANSAVMKAADVLDVPKLDLADAPVAVVYHNVIDKVGDESETEGRVFEAVEQACNEVERLVQTLVRAGCGKVLVTSDHGFLFQMQNPESYAYVEVPGLSQLKSDESVSCDHTRRFVVGKTIPKSDSLIEYAAVDLSLEGDYRVAIPRGVTRLRLRGSGARFVHGGASLQENVIPVITVTVSKDVSGSRPTGVEGFATGRTVITGHDVSVIVYQVDPCGNRIGPQTVKVGAYAADGSLVSSVEKTIELSSESGDVEERKTRVTLPLLDEVDAHASVFVR
ncbi:MAG: BREX-1 system phosphatase PglZ type A, partial [Eggerthellaceae bacterium]|nr:BREX-1 system phosphatase PglZ type A [Eggerthellaceae bacterium]